MKMVKILAVIVLCLSLSPFLSSQEMQTGSVRGKVAEENGQPLPGVSITISGPRLLGTVSVVTRVDGTFRASYLSPGSDYEIKAELSGFQTVIRKGLILNAGKTISIEIKMAQSAISTEITVVAPSPTVDIIKSEASTTIVASTLANLPLPRDLMSGMKIAPSVVSYMRGGLSRASLTGHGEGEAGLTLDGIQMNDSDNGFAYMGVDTGMAWDMVEEIGVVAMGAPASNFNSMGGMINVITKSGGNKFSGEASVYYTNDKMVGFSVPKESLAALGLAVPSIPVYSFDTSFSLGGPIIKDKLWFLGEFRYLKSEITGDFTPTVISGKQFNSYNRTFPNYIGFLKFSGLVGSNIRASAMAHFSYQNVPYYYSGWNLTDQVNNNNKPLRLNYSASLSWSISDNTVLDLRGGGLYFKWYGLYTAAADPNGPRFIDDYTTYSWGRNAGESYTYKPKVNIILNLTRFQDDFLGGNHEFKAGIEWERNHGEFGAYAKNLLTWHYYKGNPYYYRGLYGTSGPDPVQGDGLLDIRAIGTTYGSSATIGITSRIGGFIQDSFTMKRLTVNLGVRFDHMTAWSPGRVKGAASDPLALAIGEAYFVPTYGLNPYGEIKHDTWDNAFPYGTFISPRIGLTYDLFGDGTTAVKASFTRQQEPFLTGTFSGMYPMMGSFTFNWFDLNANGAPDLPGVDKYVSIGSTPLGMVSTNYLKAIDPNIKIPFEDEFAVGVDRELLKNLRIGVRYTNRTRQRIMGSVLYDQDTKRYWYTYDKAPDWWVPFTTTIPATGIYPAQTATMYFMSNNAPALNYRLTNLPEASMKYQSFEFSFEKRMSDGWQIGGSLNYTKLKGNYSLSLNSNYSTGLFSTPNSFVNATGDLPFSRPFMLRLYGTFVLPYDFMFSFIYSHQDGGPWGRTVSVRPPTAWAAANNAKVLAYSIYVEPPGTRWEQPSDNLDIKISKDLPLGFGRFGLSMDVFNLLGAYTITDIRNPAGTWLPTDADTTAGTYTAGQTRLTGIIGYRLVKFSIFYKF